MIQITASAMLTDNLFQTLPGVSPSPFVQIFFDERPLSVPAGITVAAALLQAGVQRFRTSVISGAPRAPYCMMGVCFECLVEIDGEQSRQSCLITVREGMRVKSQEGLRSLNISTEERSSKESKHGA